MDFDHKKFFDGFKEHFDHVLDQPQVDGIEFLLNQFETTEIWSDVRYIAYAFATIYHETDGSMQPVEEGFYLIKYGQNRVKSFQKSLRYFPYFGRGYVQLTWQSNYKKAGQALGVDLVSHPERALEPENAFQILSHGMFEGWFKPGQTLDRYITPTKADYVEARRIINGTDRAALIAGYARQFERLLTPSSMQTVPESQDRGDTNPPVESPIKPIIPPDVSVEVPKEKTSIWAKIVAGFAALTGLGINAGTLLQNKLEQMTIAQVCYLVAALGLIAFGIWIYNKAAKGAQMRTLALIDKAADPHSYKVELK